MCQRDEDACGLFTCGLLLLGIKSCKVASNSDCTAFADLLLPATTLL